MLGSVWSKFVPGGRNRQSHEPQQAALDLSGETLSTCPAEVEGGGGSVNVSAAPAPCAECVCSCTAEAYKSMDSLCKCTPQQHACSCSVSRKSCASDKCDCSELKHACSCAGCSCGCSLRERSGAKEEINGCGTDAALTQSGPKQHRRQHQTLSEVHERPPAYQSQASNESDTPTSTGQECLPGLYLSSYGFTPDPTNQKASTQESSSQPQPHRLPASFSVPGEEGSLVSIRSDSGYPEGWEHIRSDDIRVACTRRDEAARAGRIMGNKPLLEAATPGDQEAGTNKTSGSVAGWSSPSAEFEFVSDAPWCDVRRLLRLPNTQHPRGWEWACSGLTSALLRDRSNGSNAVEALAALGETATVGEDAGVAEASDRAGRQRCPVVRFLRSAMHSSMFSGSDFIRRHGTLGKTVTGTGEDPASESTPAILTGWGGRWQLTTIDSPRDSFSSCSGSNRSGGAPVNPFAPTCNDGESSSRPQGGSDQSQARMRHVNVCGSDAVRPLSPVESRPLTAISGAQRGTLAVDEGNAKVHPNSAHVASEVEASCSATEVSDPAESERRRALAKCFHGLMLHRVSLIEIPFNLVYCSLIGCPAQQHLESQCREALKKKGMRLNILITALPGVDADLFCRQMFSEWQEVSRQRVSCGDEFVFRAPFVVPLAEVPVIAATSFASVLPYCELRLLEEWERDAVLQEEATERRVHVCLFLIPHSALPLSTGVLALLKRLRAVACMLPLLIVQQTTSNEQILRDRGILRLQLAASDLATLEEMLLPLGSTASGPEMCAHCRRRMEEKEYQPPEVHSELEPPLHGKEFCSSDDVEKCIDGKIRDAQEPRPLKRDDYAESLDGSSSSGSRQSCSQGQPVEGGGTTPDTQKPQTLEQNIYRETIKSSRSSCTSKSGSKGTTSDDDGIYVDTQAPETLKPNENAKSINNSHSSDSCKTSSRGKFIDSGCEYHRRGDKLDGGSRPAFKHRCKMQSFNGGPLCLSAVHLPLVLQLSLSCDDSTASQCTCKAGLDSFSETVTTPLSLRGMLVEASAVLLRQRAEYGCFLPFLFQQQMLPNRAHKLRGLQQWEDEEKQQREQQQHVEALVDLRQGQIDSHPNADTAMHMQRQLDGLREQLRKMQQQLIHLQERKFLQELLREEASATLPYPSPDARVLLQNSDTGNSEREELLSQVAQTGLVLALMLGVGAILFNSMKRSSC